MPHSTEMEWAGMEDTSGVNGFDNAERGAISSMMALDGQMKDVAMEETERADDAIDYEDISDDDLPEEEEATAQSDGDGDASIDNGYGDNGEHARDPEAFPSDDADYSGDYAGDINDLFGDEVPLAAEQPVPVAQPPAPKRPFGLALPKKSGLVPPPGGYTPAYQEPRRQQAQDSPGTSSSPAAVPEVDSPPSNLDDDDDDRDDSELTPEELKQRNQFRAQRELFAWHRHEDGGDVPIPSIEEDIAQFWSSFPEYEPEQNPRFVDLFPIRSGLYNGRRPLKAPKPLQATKLRLELAPDQERLFLTSNSTDFDNAPRPAGVVFTDNVKSADAQDSQTESDTEDGNDDELVGGLSFQDFSMLCANWDVPDTNSALGDEEQVNEDGDVVLRGEENDEPENRRPIKRRKLDTDIINSLPGYDPFASLNNPERALRNAAKQVTLDLNDHRLLIDEHAPPSKPNAKRVPGNSMRDPAASRNLAKRYNISNDEAYDLLKENHQHKVRSTLGSVAVEHSMPATKLQWPFYQISLDSKQTRSFHRPMLDLKAQVGKDFRVAKPKNIKRKHIKGRDVKDVFAKAEDLTLGDNASALLLEYSEEVPTMLSNFGMGNRLINYYRKRDADDTERPKREIGETQVLLNQDKSPFANFGHVDAGDTVPTIQNGLYRAPVFQHTAKSTDFLVTTTHTYESGRKFYIRNVENLHAVGQQFPLQQVPTEHSRRVTDASKRRLRAMAFRIWQKVTDTRRRGVVLDNETLLKHIPGGEATQLRGKMREFMQFVRAPGGRESGTWAPKLGDVAPDLETIRTWISPEEICLLDSMQMGVRHLRDLGLSLGKDAEKEAEANEDMDEDTNIELRLAPWSTTKHFLNACQGKAMLVLHGDGDPTGHGLGFSFIKTSMKGGFQSLGESAMDKMNAKKRKEGGHHYNVAEQQRLYDDDIRTIWEKQRDTLSSTVDLADAEDDYDVDEVRNRTFAQNSRAPTPRTSFATPSVVGGRYDDDDRSQFSRQSIGQKKASKVMVITREKLNQFGQTEIEHIRVENPKVIDKYQKRLAAKRAESFGAGGVLAPPTGNMLQDNAHKQSLVDELARLKKNAERREARERAKQRSAGLLPATGAADTPAAGSPGPSDFEGAAGSINASANGTPNKKKGKGGDGTTKRKCANCGIEGHIKTNKKYVWNRKYRVYYCSDCDTFNPVTGQSAWEQAIEDNGGRRPHLPKSKKTSAMSTADQDGGATASSSPAKRRRGVSTAGLASSSPGADMFSFPGLQL